MSEDEACRRIDLARLARRFPALFPPLAGGELTLSGALALKHVLTAENHLKLIAAARHKSIQQTRELVAARFPSPDVPTTLRKLPEPRPAPAAQPEPSLAEPLLAAPIPPAESPRIDAPALAPPADAAARPQPHLLPPHLPWPNVPPSVPSRPAPPRHRIEPIAAQRYKQTTLGFTTCASPAHDRRNTKEPA
ncbi:MAG TPA: hypothetical protein VFS67_25090 [Polyangiaceae bacterium]|nr:hypothetical protein [Polyangiaceae bacterium]